MNAANSGRNAPHPRRVRIENREIDYARPEQDPVGVVPSAAPVEVMQRRR